MTHFEECVSAAKRIRHRGRNDKFIQPVADEILKRNAQYFNETAIGDADFTFERNGKDGVIQAVNQLAVIQLRARNHFDELLELRLGRRARSARQWRLVRRMFCCSRWRAFFRPRRRLI
jgi:hypothetical protein